MDYLSVIKELNAPVCVSGRESGIAQVISRMAAPFCDEIRTDPMGSLICVKRAAEHECGPDGCKIPKRLMLAAHMDSIGVVATYIDDDGFIRFGKLGGLEVRTLTGCPVRFENGVRGVIACQGDVELKDLKQDKLYIDIGAKDSDAARALLRPGDCAVFSTESCAQGDTLISPYLDNRVGCAVLLDVMSRIGPCANDVYFVFTVQEEVGLRGSKPAAYSVAPDMAVAVDVCDAGDTPDFKPKNDVKLGGGPVINIMDSSILCHSDVVSMLQSCAGDCNIGCQLLVSDDGGTDAGSIHVSRGGVPTGVLSVPTRYVHSPQEMINVRDAEQCAKLLAALCGREL